MRHPLLLAIFAFVVWSGAFLVIYAAQATGCSLNWQNSILASWGSSLRVLLVLLFAASLAAVVGVYVLLHRSASPASETSMFLHRVATSVSIAAVFSTAFCFAGVFWLTLCAG
jgi:hypothetical protein